MFTSILAGSGATAGTSTVSPSTLGGSGPLSGTAAGIASTTSTLRGAGRLTGTAAGTSTPTATITSTATPLATLGSRLKREFVTSTLVSTTRTWNDAIVADAISATNGTALTTPKGNVAVGVQPTHGYDGGVSFGGATYKNVLLFGAFKFPADMATATFNLNYLDQWNLYLDPVTGILHFFAGTTGIAGEAQSNASVKDGGWHRFVAHYTTDGAAGVGKLWIDGTLQTATQTTGNDVVPSLGMMLGYYSGTGSEVAMSRMGIALGAPAATFSAGDIAAINAFLASWV